MYGDKELNHVRITILQTVMAHVMQGTVTNTCKEMQQ